MGDTQTTKISHAPDPIAVLLFCVCVSGVVLQAAQEMTPDKLFFLRYFTCLSAVICALGCLGAQRSALGAYLYLTGIVGVLTCGAGWWVMMLLDFTMVPRTVLEQASMYSLHVLVPCGALAHVLFGVVPRKIPGAAALATMGFPVAYGLATILAQIYYSARAPYGFMDVRRMDLAGGLELAVMFCLFWLLLTIAVVRVQMVRRRWEDLGIDDVVVPTA